MDKKILRVEEIPMAFWMVHLRIADILLDKFEDLEKTDFIMGNIAPDSDVPSEDWSYHVPFLMWDKEVREV